jgi:hypothetical protein
MNEKKSEMRKKIVNILEDFHMNSIELDIIDLILDYYEQPKLFVNENQCMGSVVAIIELIRVVSKNKSKKVAVLN